MSDEPNDPPAQFVDVSEIQNNVCYKNDGNWMLPGLKDTGPMTITGVWLNVIKVECPICHTRFAVSPDGPIPIGSNEIGPIGAICDDCAMKALDNSATP